jgi:hypothetical protein
MNWINQLRSSATQTRVAQPHRWESNAHPRHRCFCRFTWHSGVCDAHGDRDRDGLPHAARGACGRAALSGNNSSVVVRARILHCGTGYLGTLGSTSAPGNHRAVGITISNYVCGAISPNMSR